ncbi:MAG: DUF1540 domain-containing protein [Flavonifractor plautii]
MNKTPNNSIKCSVNSCAYHCGEQNYCTLNEIKVGCLRLQRDQLRLHRVRLLPAGRPRQAAASAEPSIHAKSRVPDRERAILWYLLLGLGRRLGLRGGSGLRC